MAELTHPVLNHPQCLLEALVFCCFVVVVCLHVKCCNVIHHLQHKRNQTNVTFLPLKSILHVVLYIETFNQKKLSVWKYYDLH